MKLVDQPREAYQIYDTCENKMNIFIFIDVKGGVLENS